MRQPPADAEALRPLDARLARVDPGALDRLLERLRAAGVAHELRTHEPARHARHLAAIWGVALPEAARATLFAADGAPVLAVVPADRKVSAPRFAARLGAGELRVLRADRGVGRLGWSGLPGAPGALPAVPGVFGARLLAEELILQHPRLIIALAPGRSAALAPADYVAATGATVARFASATRLLPEGGMTHE